MPKFKHPDTGDVIETDSRALAVDLKINGGYREVKPSKAQSQSQSSAPAKPKQESGEKKPDSK